MPGEILLYSSIARGSLKSIVNNLGFRKVIYYNTVFWSDIAQYAIRLVKIPAVKFSQYAAQLIA